MFDRRQEFSPVGFAKAISVWRRLDRRLDAGQRGAQVVSDGGEQGGADLVDLNPNTAAATWAMTVLAAYPVDAPIK